MNKRTENQIQRDYKEIRKHMEKATNLKELQEMVGLTYGKMITSLKSHPRIYAKFKEKFAKDSTYKGLSEKSNKQYIVIDASITGIHGITELLYQQENKILLTSITVRELAKLQRYDDVQAVNARRILRMAAEDEERFEQEIIDEYDTPDDSILQFCLKNKEKVTLYTSDKEMYNMAKAYRIRVKMFSKTEYSVQKRDITFSMLQKVGKDLVMDLDYTNSNYNMSVKVISQGKEYDKGFLKLKIGDQILVASKKQDYVAFAHYQIISLTESNNSNLISAKRIYDINNLNVKYSYKCFLREFKRKIS